MVSRVTLGKHPSLSVDGHPSELMESTSELFVLDVNYFWKRSKMPLLFRVVLRTGVFLSEKLMWGVVEGQQRLSVERPRDSTIC
jgi:hypothetical protein